MIELAVICGLLVALLAWQQVDRRHERQEVVKQIDSLLLRIQAPQVAVTRDWNDSAEPGPPAIDMSDGPGGDEDFWMSREELADAEASREMKQRG